MATLTGQSIASSYEQLLHVDTDGGGNTTTLVPIKDGDNGTTFCLQLSTTKAMIEGNGSTLYFYDEGGESISADNAGVLSIAAGAEIDLTATAVDLNGTLDVSGTLTQGGASQFNSTITVGVDGTGYDVIFYGDSASSNMTWDQNGNTDGQLTLNDSRLFVDQDEDDNAIYIDCEATNNNAISVNSKYGIYVNQDISGGRAAYFYRDLAEAGSFPLVRIVDDHTSNTQPALNIQQDGAGYGLEIDQNGDNNALYIDSEATNNNAIQVYGKYGIYVNQDISGGRAVYLVRNLAEAGSSPLVTIIDNHTSNTQPALKIHQDGDAAHIEFSGVGTGGIKFKASATDSADANTLDDYEEGTWTAVVTDATPNNMTMDDDTGYYTKVGNLVTVSGHFNTSSLGSASGNIKITGLPFTIANNNAAYSSGAFGYAGSIAITAGHSVGYYGAINNTQLELMVWDVTGGVSAMQASEWTADGGIMIGFSYRAA